MARLIKEKDGNGYTIVDGQREFGVSFWPTTPEPKDN